MQLVSWRCSYFCWLVQYSREQSKVLLEAILLFHWAIISSSRLVSENHTQCLFPRILFLGKQVYLKTVKYLVVSALRYFAFLLDLHRPKPHFLQTCSSVTISLKFWAAQVHVNAKANYFQKRWCHSFKLQPQLQPEPDMTCRQLLIPTTTIQCSVYVAPCCSATDKTWKRMFYNLRLFLM